MEDGLYFFGNINEINYVKKFSLRKLFDLLKLNTTIFTFAFLWTPKKMDLSAVEQLKNVLSSITIEKDQIIY